MSRNIDLNGAIVNELELTGSIAGTSSLTGSMYIPPGYTPVYSGDYEATPTLENQIFQTHSRLMLDNFEVKATPLSDTRTADTDGYTITIL